jgi:hypothetical protein
MGCFSLFVTTVVGCHRFFLASTGTPSLRKENVMKQDQGKGGAEPSASQHRWTSTTRKEAVLGVHYAMVRASLPPGVHNLTSDINLFDTTDVIARSYPNTSPISFYHRGKPFFESAHTFPHVFEKRHLISFAQVYQFFHALGGV